MPKTFLSLSSHLSFPLEMHSWTKKLIRKVIHFAINIEGERFQRSGRKRNDIESRFLLISNKSFRYFHYSPLCRMNAGKF